MGLLCLIVFLKQMQSGVEIVFLILPSISSVKTKNLLEFIFVSRVLTRFGVDRTWLGRCKARTRMFLFASCKNVR
jgi:hypothetical protein